MYGYPGYAMGGYNDSWIWAVLIVLLILFLLWGNNSGCGCNHHNNCGCSN